MTGSPRFVGAPLVAGTGYVASAALSQGEPPLPASFRWGEDDLPVLDVIKTWRSTKLDRGDAYLAKHWYEVRTGGGRVAVLYFDRKAKAGRPRWWLYSIRTDA